MIETLNSKDGALTAKINNIFVHSSYSPKKEALNYARKMRFAESRSIILLEPCLNYLAEIIKRENPQTKIISIYFEEFFFNNDTDKSDHKYLYNKDNSKLQQFLSHTVTELDIESLKIIDWPPAEKIFGISSELRNIIGQHIREMYGNITTVSGFGKIIFRNYFHNFSSIEHFFKISMQNSTVFIAGSGPSLKNEIDFLKNNRNRLFLIALPSSVSFLQHNLIKPDLIVTTDPGYYAKQHLYSSESIPVAAPLTAALPISIQNTGIIEFKQNYFLETFLSNNQNTVIIPQHGTVAGSAIYIALQISSGPILISGFDFSYHDLLSHNRPHSFDSIIDSQADRYKPLNSLYFYRNIIDSERISNFTRTNKALKTYSGWFAANSRKFNSRCFFMERNFPPPGAFQSISCRNAEGMLGPPPQASFIRMENTIVNERKYRLHQMINSSVTMLEDTAEIIQHLQSGSEIVQALNNPFIFNLFLPSLLEIKRHYIHKNGKEVQNKAVSLIRETITFIESFLNYV
ncbi:MAG: DUF115 domain-containing protein [Spirochaetales bacterium]|uniref:DUF115 domain-containing protein n=1 Tax=Candidatus Thalassospirochaeta sargassi TaxID=3119039 RepID=A0AAJ1MN92_9SPIO|nr:DUF115 domain-containing protein [Spirochaetales bacterium]